MNTVLRATSKRRAALATLAVSMSIWVATDNLPARASTPSEGTPVEDCQAALVVTQLGDESFADSAHEGLLLAEEELGIEVQVIEAAQDSDVEINLEEAPSAGNTVSFGIGFQTVDAVTVAAESNPDAFYGIVDAEVDLPNVASLLFNEPEGAFLAGVVAGEVTETNIVGFVGGLEIPLIEGFYAGFAAGAMSVNPDVEVLANYAGAFDDPGRGKEIALSEYAEGADVIFHAAGGTGLGVFEAANESGDGHWVIGVDADQLDLAPERTLTSMMKRVDIAVFETIESVCAGTFEAGTHVYGLADGGVGLAPSTATNTPQDVIDLADSFAQRIISGEIVVPTSADELEAFEPPAS